MNVRHLVLIAAVLCTSCDGLEAERRDRWEVHRPIGTLRANIDFRLVVPERPDAIRLAGPGGEILSLSPISVLTQNDIIRVEVGPDPSENASYAAYLHLKPETGKMLRTYAHDHMNDRLAILINGQILMTPRIMAEFGPVVVLSGAYTKSEIVALAEKLAP